MASTTLIVLAILAYRPSVSLPPTSFQWEQYGPALISDGGADVQIKRRSNMSSSRSGSGRKKPGHASHGGARPGAAGPGETFDPTRMPDERRPDEGVHEGPAPGIPMSDRKSTSLNSRPR